MPIIYRYITVEILRTFAVVLAVVVGIYLTVDFFEKIDDFLNVGLSFSRAAIFFLHKLPFIIAQVMPVGILISVIMTLGLMNKRNELTALKSSGMSPIYLLKPLIGLGLVSGLLLFCLSEAIVPMTVGKANEVWLQEVRKKTVTRTREKNIWLKGNRRINHIAVYHPEGRALFGLTVYEFDDSFRIIRRLDAKKALFENNRWLLEDVMLQHWTSDENFEVLWHDQMEQTLDFSPDDLSYTVKRSEEMGYLELREYIEKVETEGYDAAIYRVDLHAKAAFPVVCLVVCLIGSGLALKRGFKEHLPAAVISGIATAFLYWVLHSFSLSLGYAQMLPPLAAAWLANFVFLCAAVINLLHID
jgi:lipopolysaccharide export system permease protein